MQAAAPSGPSSATRPQTRILFIHPTTPHSAPGLVCRMGAFAMIRASRYSYQSEFWTGTEICFVGRAAIGIVSRLGGSRLRKSEADDVASDALMLCALLATYLSWRMAIVELIRMWSRASSVAAERGRACTSTTVPYDASLSVSWQGRVCPKKLFALHCLENSNRATHDGGKRKK